MKRPILKRSLAGFLTVIGLASGCSDSSGPDQSSEDCAFARELQLGVGEVVVAPVGDKPLCLAPRQAGEYVLIPFVSSQRDTSLWVDIVISGAGFTAIGPSAALLPRFQTPPVMGDPGLADDSIRARFDLELRESEARLHRTARPGGLSHSLAPVARAVALPVPGSRVELNVTGRCDVSSLRSGSVMAVTQHAIVVADIANPPGGFTAAEFADFGLEFDTFVWPQMRAAFGDPTDIDANGRVILFFTRGVNEMSPPGGLGVIAGFFWGGDLFPKRGTAELAPCGGSNEAEILYLAVPDPNQQIRPATVTADALRKVTLSTIGHELQHLINSGTRLHVTHSPLEEKWLNEGLSFMAEELLFYAASGLAPRQNLGVEDVRRSPQANTAFEQFAVSNLGRLNIYLQATHFASPLGTDVLETRGAAWSFLRYVADRDPRPDEQLLKALVSSPTNGLQNLGTTLGADPLEWMRDWSVATFTDDLVPVVDKRFSNPSWNFRQLISALRVDQRYPLRTIGLPPGESTVRLPAGGAVYTYFMAPEGSRITVGALTEGNSQGAALGVSLARIR